MCGIAGIYHLQQAPIVDLNRSLVRMNQLLAHRGPDGQGIWTNVSQSIGLAHRRLSIIDLSEHATQPMVSAPGFVISFNGEIYNHHELRASLSSHWDFQTQSDTEVILAAYAVYGVDCVKHLKGMFSFAIWDGQQLFCARDHFGIKPFYYTEQQNHFYFASETKALLPFLSSISTHRTAFNEYMTFQCAIGQQTLFDGVYQLEPAHAMLLSPKGKKVWRYWDIHFEEDNHISEEMCYQKLSELIDEAISMHMRADVPVAAYVSGGVDSSLIGILASQKQNQALPFFHGRFLEDIAYDESAYAHLVAEKTGNPLYVKDITAFEFSSKINDIIYYMDFPVAGPGVFPQYMVSEMAAKEVKVILGGQGGDEIFGGYARYLIAYFEQCIKAELEGNTTKDLNLSILSQHLEVLNAYKPMMKQFFKSGLFESFEKRYFNLINRSNDFSDSFMMSDDAKENCYQAYLDIFNPLEFAKPNSCFNGMLHFDMKTSLPGLLHVEDRVSMAHGLESRVPFLYWPLVEFVAKIPTSLKFSNGQMKHLLLKNYANILPKPIRERKDKMGFPVPLSEWMQGELKTFIMDILISGKNRHHSNLNYDSVITSCEQNGIFSRKVWGLFCLELWQQQFHDKSTLFKHSSSSETIKI